ncbi:hypothetical protein [Sphingomonas sp. KR3-1]|uniref:hypothetical protein n=1 Tax=Sphingomonas sp. KR3-1 TaxID=3156611 RepID=UPI0032B46522
MPIQWNNIPTDIFVWVITVVIGVFAGRILPFAAKNLLRQGAHRTWFSVKREWYCYYLSVWEPGNLPKGGKLEIYGLFPFALRARTKALTQEGILKLRAYPQGSVRISGEHLCVRIISTDPHADMSLVFRVPATSFSSGHLLGTYATITVEGDPCAGACVLSTTPLSKTKIKSVLSAYHNVLVERSNAFAVTFADPHASG